MPKADSGAFALASLLDGSPPEEIVGYLKVWIEEEDGDAAFIAKPLGVIKLAQRVANVARDFRFSMESIY